jgi:hypothetical protein
VGGDKVECSSVSLTLDAHFHFSKCIKVSVGIKKTAAADKPAHKKVDAVGNIIEWDSLPAILQGMNTVAEYNRFREAVSLPK